jgi:hypothetical protein
MFTYNDLLSNTIDVQGFSHRPRSQFDAAHAAMPTKPMFASECCSCNTMRGEDRRNGNTQPSFNGDCQQRQTNSSDGASYIVGTMVWTLFDYYGEPSNGGWPYVSSTFGAYDLAGFPKGGSYWFRSQWLYSIPDGSPDKTFNTSGLADGRDHMVHIVEGWDPDAPIKVISENKTFAEPCFGNSAGDGAETQQMTFSSSGGIGLIKNSAGLCVDPSACPTDKVTHGGKGCFPLSFLPCKQSMSFAVDKTGQQANFHC